VVNPEMLAIAFLLAVANNAIVDYLANPVRKRYPDFDLWFLPYVAFATGGVIAYIADVNLFAFIPGLVAVPGRLLTAAVIGGGSGLIHKVFDHADVEGGVLAGYDIPGPVLSDEEEKYLSPETLQKLEVMRQRQHEESSSGDLADAVARGLQDRGPQPFGGFVDVDGAKLVIDDSEANSTINISAGPIDGLVP